MWFVLSSSLVWEARDYSFLLAANWTISSLLLFLPGSHVMLARIQDTELKGSAQGDMPHLASSYAWLICSHFTTLSAPAGWHY